MQGLQLPGLLLGVVSGGGGTPTPTPTPTAPAYLLTNSTIAANPVLVYGTQRMWSATTVPYAYKVETPTARQMDMPWTGDYISAAAMISFMAGEDASVRTWYDQMNSGFDVAGITFGNLPPIDPTITLGGSPVLGFDSSGSALDKFLYVDNPPIVENAFTIFMVERGQSLHRRSGQVALTSQTAPPSGTPTTTYGSLYVGSNASTDSTNFQNVLAATTSTRSNNTSDPVFEARYTVYAISSGTSLKFYFPDGNLRNTAATGAPATAMPRMFVGRGGGNQFGSGQRCAHVVYNVVLSDADIALQMAQLSLMFNQPNRIASPATKTLLIAGDSLIASQQAYAANNIRTFMTINRTDVEILNDGLSGEQGATAYTNRVARYAKLLTTGRPAIVLTDYGSNDIALGGASDATVVTTMTNLATYWRTKTATIWLGIATIIPRADASWSAPKEAFRIAYNTYIRTNYVAMGYDYLLDVANDPVIGDPASTQAYPLAGYVANDTTKYPDNVHPYGRFGSGNSGYRQLALSTTGYQAAYAAGVAALGWGSI